MSLRDDLEYLRELLTPEENRITGVYAQNRDGLPVAANHPTACQWCVVGAILKIGSGSEDRITELWLALRVAAGNPFNLERWGDNASHQEILDTIDKAITACSI